MKKKTAEEKYIVFKKKHPKLHIANILISTFLPMCLVLLSSWILNVNEDRSALILYSAFWAFVFSIGLDLCILCEYNKDAFRNYIVYPITIGAALTFVNLFLACNELPALNLEEQFLAFQLYSYLSIFIFLINYSVHREAIADYISAKTHLTEDQMDNRKEGLLNYIWFRKIHLEFGLGWIYYFNAFLTSVLFLFFVGNTLLIFFKFLASAVMVLASIAAFLLIILEIFSWSVASNNKKSYLAPKKKKGIGKIPYFYEIGGIALLLILLWCQVQCFIAL